MVDLELIIFYLVALDSLFANVAAWFFPKWSSEKLGGFGKHFPVTRGWAAIYLVLVLWVGWLLLRLQIMF